MRDAAIVALILSPLFLLDIVLDLWRIRLEKKKAELEKQKAEKPTPPRVETEPDPCDKRHAMIVVAAQPVKSEMTLQQEHTVALQRCRNCGIHISVNYAGNWKLEDFHKEQLDALLEGMMK